MTTAPGPASARAHRARSAGRRSRQRGVVLFITLLVIVVMSMAAVTLMRSVDTVGAVTAALAFREATIAPTNRAVEQAVTTLGAVNPHGDEPGRNYFATIQAGASASGIPALLQGAYPPERYAEASLPLLESGLSGTEIRYVIERLCNAPGPPALGTCDLSPPVAPAGTRAEDLVKILTGRVPYYRVTMRVDGPAGAVTFAQATLRYPAPPGLGVRMSWRIIGE